jgi:hypothetical protein
MAIDRGAEIILAARRGCVRDVVEPSAKSQRTASHDLESSLGQTSCGERGAEPGSGTRSTAIA